MTAWSAKVFKKADLLLGEWAHFGATCIQSNTDRKSLLVQGDDQVSANTAPDRLGNLFASANVGYMKRFMSSMWISHSISARPATEPRLIAFGGHKKRDGP